MRLRLARPRHRRIVAALLGGTLVLAPAAVAADLFTDVPSSSTFYVNVHNIAMAGLTTGCAAGKFCPKDAVTREQMAAFLNRTGPRMSIAYFSFPLGNTNGSSPPGNSIVASTPVRALGWEALLITANFFTVGYSAGTFPCEIVYRFRLDGEIVGQPVMYDRFNTAPVNTWVTRNMSGQYANVVAKGNHTVSLTYQTVTNNCSTFPGNGTLVVEVVPFSWDMSTVGPDADPSLGYPTSEQVGEPAGPSNGAAAP